ncbi:trypsin-like peptidase domain-containing protein [Arsenicicoccus piscis]|uniref:PDZ domain-containing protein n=1 Tax=Arsenicicoccus piscis TaxID=673954 RepID=A0ABQ6HS89_9MICO|nr:trypsin-like peptidase domain-containing protein [Arsenicicoccus piscis]MCH8627946.1 trypsin-like peptidase domain-containing protein [Arsenicicoccus piscis]GMA20718.1 hypothetical protein GCM10025862_27390 [Arsenicicoccus piscis]
MTDQPRYEPPRDDQPRHDQPTSEPTAELPWATPAGSTAAGSTAAGGTSSSSSSGAPAGAYPTSHQTQPLAAAGTSTAAAGTSAATRTKDTGTRLRWWHIPATAIITALLASGGTAALVGSGGSPSGTAPSAGTYTQAPVVQADASKTSWTTTASAVTPSVVSISILQNGQTAAEGSGVILDAQGHIVTNNHVVSEISGGQIIVTLSNYQAYQATIVGTDPSTDLAVVKMSKVPSGLKPIAFGDSNALKVGEPTMAVGNPLGLSGTVTTGIVSALNRPVTTQQSTQGQDPFGGLGNQGSAEQVVTNAVQTSAPINPGNSGGALVNAGGQLIGINSSIASLGGGSSGSTSGSIGIGFAIPSNEVKSITNQLISTGKAQHAYLGVSSVGAVVTDGEAQRLAARISEVVSGSPADKAGLKQGDAIISIDGEPVTDATSLAAQVRERSVGQQVTLQIIRGGSQQSLTATLAAKPNS